MTRSSLNSHWGRTGMFNRVAWAHPEFGQIIAACSSDCNVVIFEEILEGGDSACSWVERARMVDNHGEIHALEFAPRHLGLLLAALGEDGVVRIYEAVDIMQMSVWPLRDEFSLLPKSAQQYSSISSLSFNQSSFDPPQIVIGHLDSVQIYQYYQQHRRWQMIGEVVSGFVVDVSWAPSLARSYNLIASAFAEQDVVVCKVKAPAEVVDKWTLPVRACRVSWNMAGTILATSSNDGTIQVWMKAADETWISTQTIRPS
uniref:Anaphase-promoting complex subunit 4 WD40 domain-containing protein n=1 Tax=Spongospora subterranea TaxID=70186 RepID=A0A0H5QPY1_9EUKA|eukprot:CRZ03476.1 hypothetical protein [Spongospora subterranea]